MAQKLNFFVASFLGIVSLSLISEIFMEDDPMDKIDDVLFLILGIVAIFWYKKNATKKTIAPVVLTVLGVVIKFGAIVVEHADKEALGDDIGIFVAMVIALVLVIYQYLQLKKAK